MTSTNQSTTPITLARPKQTAKHFNISKMTLHRWRKRPGFPQPLQLGQVVLYNIPAITSWLNGSGVAQ